DFDLTQDGNDLLRAVFLPCHVPAPSVPVSLTFPLVQNSPVTSGQWATTVPTAIKGRRLEHKCNALHVAVGKRLQVIDGMNPNVAAKLLNTSAKGNWSCQHLPEASKLRGPFPTLHQSAGPSCGAFSSRQFRLRAGDKE